MHFSNSTYQLDLVQISERVFSLKLYTDNIIRTDILEVKFDPDYLLSLYGLFDQLFINGVSFSVLFPMTDTMNTYKISAEYDTSRDWALITITHQSIYGQINTYTVISNLDEEYLQILDEFDQYIYPYLSPEELEDLDSASVDLTFKIEDRQRKMKADAIMYHQLRLSK